MTLDVITVGRSSVDLYGAQIGGRLEDMRGFAKYIGGSPTNMAAGTARHVCRRSSRGSETSISAVSFANSLPAKVSMCAE